jgi:hypothetical protein
VRNSAARQLLPAAFIPALLLCAAALAAESSTPSRLKDPEDGWLDFSQFLDSARGFVPLVMPITEPAVGYGAAGAIVFIDRDVRGQGGGYTRPNMTVLGGLGTENGTRGLFATHLGTWREDRIRTIAAIADMNVNLDYFGLGGGRDPAETGIGYTIAARGGLVGGNFRIGTTPIWAGLRYTLVKTSVSLSQPNPGLPGIFPADTTEQRIAAVTPSFTYDTRDNFFTPTRGWYVDLAALVARESFGGDRDFERLALTVIHHFPVSRDLFFGVRGSARSSSDDTPFYLRPYVGLRGVQAMRYQGEDAGEVEAELRWQVHPRFSIVGFAGVGAARNPAGALGRDESVAAAGAGFRYLLARKHGMHMGLDVAGGPDKPAIYVVFGNAWMRP